MMRRTVLSFAALVLLAAVALGAWAAGRSSVALDGPTSGDGISLVRPAFAQQASFLDSEAGIAAYAKVPGATTPAVSRQAFKVIEVETADYIVGVVEVNVTGLPVMPHVFVHEDGWVVAYYLREEHVSYAWPYGHGVIPPDDILFRAIQRVLDFAGAPAPQPSYYDFEFPQATRVSVVYASTPTTDFGLKVPPSFQVFEAAQAWGDGEFIDRTAQVQKGQFQTWKGLLVLVYSES